MGIDQIDLWEMDHIRLAGLLGALGVAAGAFGAHGLKARTDDASRLQMFSTAAQYQMVHAIAIGALGARSPRAMMAWAAGTTLFSGSLYLYGYTGNKKFGMIAPIGGTLFIAGWVLLMLS